VFRFPTIVASKNVLGRETVWVTLRERPPPTPPAAIFAATRLKPRKRLFDTVARTGVFAKALKAGDWAEATMMLSVAAKLQFGKVKATGSTEVADEIRKVLGRNIAVHNEGFASKENQQKKKRKKKERGYKRGRLGDEDRDTGESGGSGREKTGGKGRPRQRQRRGGRRPKSAGAFSPGNSKRGRRKGKDRGGGSATDPSSCDEETAAIRASVEKEVRAELANLDRLKAAGVASWKELGHATGLLSLAKAKKRNKARAKGQSKGLLDAAGITVKDPKVDLKVLVWDGFFGADVKEMRMQLPELYPSTSTPYDQNEDFAARTLGEAIAVGDRAAPALIEEMRAEKKKKVDPVGKMVDAVLERDQQLRRVGTRRREAMISPSDLAASFPETDPRMAPLRHHPVDNGEHKDKEGASHEEEGDEGTEKLPESASTRNKEEAPRQLLLENGGAARTDKADDDGNKSDGQRGKTDATTATTTTTAAAIFKQEERLDEEQDQGDLERLSSSPLVETRGGDTSAAAITTTLPPLEPSVIHAKLEGTASREKRLKREKRLAKQKPPDDPPGDVDLARRRGGLGVLPGSASLVEVPAVGDWEKEVARENGGLLRELETRFGGLICHQDAINAVSYSPDGRRLATASSDGTIKLWDPSSGKQAKRRNHIRAFYFHHVRVLTGHHEGLPVWDVAWSGDSMFLVSCAADRSLVIWNTAAAEPFVRRFLGHSDHVKRCAFADTRGQAVLSCGSDGTVRKWVLTPNVPAPPPKPFVTHKTRTWVMLNWRPAAGSNEQVTAYVVSWRLGRKGKFDDELTVAGDQLRRDVTGLLPGSLYFFRVAGVNRMGQGPWSEATDMVDTEMDLPLAMERPNTEAVTPYSIAISFFAPRPTLPKMKIQSFVLQAKGGGLDFDESDTQEFTWNEAIAGAAALRGKERMHAITQRQSIVSISRSRSVTSMATTGDRGSSESGHVGRDGSFANTTEGPGCVDGAGIAGTIGGSTESGSVGIVRLGSFANTTHGVAGADGTSGEVMDGGSTESGSVGTVRLGSFAKLADGAAGADGASGGVVDMDSGSTESGSVGVVRLGSLDGSSAACGIVSVAAGGSQDVGGDGGAWGMVAGSDGSFAKGNNTETEPAAADGAGGAEGTAQARTTAGGPERVSSGEGESGQSGQAPFVRLSNFARRNTRIGRVDHKLRRHQRRRRKAHHYLMSLTYTGLLPGMDYHIRVAGISSVGQGAFSVPTFSARTPSVRPHACPPPTASSVFFTAIMISWAEGDDGGSSITGFFLRPVGGWEAEEISVPRIKRSYLFEGLQKGHTYRFQVRAANNEGTGPWSEPSQPVRTLTERPAPPRAPALSISHPPPGPLSLWLSLFLPDEDGGDPITAMLLETRRHGGTQPPEWSRCERHPVPSTADRGNQHGSSSASTPAAPTESEGGDGGGGGSSGDGKTGGTLEPRRLGRVGRGDTGGIPGSTRKARKCCEIVVLVEGLQPRTYYSFRASAVNARGASDPGPPCRRVRTSAPRPPSWVLAQDIVNTTAVAVPAAPATTPSPTKSAGGTAGVAFRCLPPRATSSGLGACTVRWEEPFSNGAAVEQYQVEVVSLGPEVEGNNVGGVEDRDKKVEDADKTSANTPAVPLKEEEGVSGDAKKGNDVGREEQQDDPCNQPTLSAVMHKAEMDEPSETTTASPPPPPPEVVALPAPQLAGREGGRVVREVKQRFPRAVPSHLRHLVIRGLATGGDYVFRVSASNTAGMGEPGPWTEVVRVVDPADEC
ncbi:unnamed protein product, partial [Ectocarpus fasciculatus]